MPICGAGLHVFEGIADICVAKFIQQDGVGIVRFNGDESYAFIFVVINQLHDALLVQLRSRTVIAGEGDHQDFGGGVVFEAVCLVVDSREAEVWSWGADGENRMVWRFLSSGGYR